jgi:hypothetical protein
MTTPLFKGKIEKGKLLLTDVVNYRKHIEKLEGERIVMSVKKYRESRSDNQNKFYWGVVVKTIADYCGYETDEMHEALKYKFLNGHVEKGLIKMGSTSDLTTDEFAQYVNKVVIWAARELQVYIPDPESFEF